MKNYLNPALDKNGLHQMSTLALAHVGDSVFELMVRSKLAEDGISTSKNLHRATISIVNANSQAEATKLIIDMLTDEEKTVFTRGRNSSPKSIPKNSTREQYALSTALETLFGYLFLQQNYDRINELFAIIISNNS